MTLSMVRNRGNVSQEELEAFYAATGSKTSTRDYPWVVSKQLVIMLIILQIHQLTLVFKKICLVKKISKFYATLF
jgi:hypothetical protein